MTDLEEILTRALDAVVPDYCTWPLEQQERYRVDLPKEDDFRIRQIMLRELFGIDVPTRENLDGAYESLSHRQNFILNQAMLPVQGIGEDLFYPTEYFSEGESILDYPTMYDYDLADHVFQEEYRVREYPGYKTTPYQGCLYHEWARMRMDGNFYYGDLTMAALYLKDRIETLGNERIKSLIPYRFVDGKDHGKPADGGFTFDSRLEAGGFERHFDELHSRFQQYLTALDSRLRQEFDDADSSAVYLFDRSEPDEPSLYFVFSSKAALAKVRPNHFVRDCRTLLRDVAEFEVFVERECGPALAFIEAAHADIMANFNPKVLRFRKKKKIVFTEGAIDDLRRL
jgi:hypothetical protein